MRSNQVSIVGIGRVGLTIAQLLVAQNITSDIVLVDKDCKRIEAEDLDFQYACDFIPTAHIRSGVLYDVCKSRIIIIAASAGRQFECHDDMAKKNMSIYRDIVPVLHKANPTAIYIVASHPNCVLTYLTWKLTGIKKNKIMGIGGMLETSRMNSAVSKRYDLPSASAVRGFVIGDCASSGVPVWSSTSIAGFNLLGNCKNKDAVFIDRQEFDYNVIDASKKQLSKLKSHPVTSTAFATAALVKDILYNKNNIRCVSMYLKGLYGIEQDVFGCSPAVIGIDGIQKAMIVPLKKWEKDNLVKSVDKLVKDCNSYQCNH